ncbi:MAG: hypothetical protein JNM65_10200 [Verrucomicrobiaceae bacterium]|nr:hypothetical protein [Verrucomicrobiaceae bacterium]
MTTHRTSNKSSTAAKGGLPGIQTGRPSIAGGLPKGHEQRFEPAPIAEAEFLRLPSAKGRCRYTGLSRSGLVSVAKAAGAFISVRLPGRVRGAVCIDKAKLTVFLKGGAGHE